jgi:hypothetical protein
MTTMKNITITILLSGALFVACEKIPSAGFIKDSNGISTTYKNLKPEDVFKTMNGERFEHCNIPLGEDFYIINNNIKGFAEKEGKVSIGSSMLITSATGDTLLFEPDLFKGNDVFAKDSLNNLRSLVSTGAPMVYDSFYHVAVRYWDKYGKGELTNELTIETIDIP